MGLERIKYAGLLASQEEAIEVPQPEKNLEEYSEEIPMDESTVNEKAQVGDEQNSAEPIKPAEVSDISAKSNVRKKPDLRK